jgi:hypothetical protein
MHIVRNERPKCYRALRYGHDEQSQRASWRCRVIVWGFSLLSGGYSEVGDGTQVVAAGLTWLTVTLSRCT